MKHKVLPAFVIKYVDNAEARQILSEIRSEAAENGTSELTMDEINAEIALYRKEKREKLTQKR